ncbi:hypothetical protein LXA43DRAFT_1066801 [Ganoderma leucocontextum]|nr:hypothetical protein LXA43DRAFT_1066801 [Ganoderma leucocontextum]
MHDEILSQRSGLIPLNVDPRLFGFRTQGKLVSKLNVECQRAKKPPKDALRLTTGDLDVTVFAANPPAATNKDIVFAKPPPEQIIEVEKHAVKGLGKENAKWSAVGTDGVVPPTPARPVQTCPAEHAEKFTRCFSPGVVRVGAHGEVSIDEHNLRRETMSREVLRHKEFDGCVELKRIRDWFIFSVESEGPYTPESLLPEAIKVMCGKIALVCAAAEALLADYEGLGSGAVGGPDADSDIEMNGE